MKIRFLIFPLAVAVLAGGCGVRPTPEAAAPAQTNAVATPARNEFVGELHRKLDLCDQKISELGRKMESLNEEAKAEGSKAIESWRAQRAQLGQKLDEVKQSSQEVGQDIKAGCESAVAELEKAFEKLKSRFKE